MKKALSILTLSILITVFSSSSSTARSDAPRLLVFGDSLTRGLYATKIDYGFKTVLAELLEAELVGQSGNSLPGLVEIWKTWNWPADVIVVEIGLNDLCVDCEWTLSDEEWLRLYTLYIFDLKATGAEVVICTMFAAHPEQAKEYEHFMLRNQMIRMLAERTQVKLADLYAATADCPECLSDPDVYSPFPPDYHGDKFHPSDYGHEIIAKTIFDVLRDVIYIPVIGNDF